MSKKVDTMRCKTVQKRLDRFVRRELEPRLQAAIEVHLEQCDVCRQHLAQEERLTAILKNTAEPPALPKGLEDRIIEAARRRQSEYVVAGPASGSPSSKRSWNRKKGWRALVPSSTRTAQATVLASGILLGILMGQQTWHSVHSSISLPASQNDPRTAYRLDCLSDAPDGSLAESFLVLTATSSSREP